MSSPYRDTDLEAAQRAVEGAGADSYDYVERSRGALRESINAINHLSESAAKLCRDAESALRSVSVSAEFLCAPVEPEQYDVLAEKLVAKLGEMWWECAESILRVASNRDNALVELAKWNVR